MYHIVSEILVLVAAHAASKSTRPEAIPDAWIDVDCLDEWERWRPLRDVLGQDDGDGATWDWAERMGFRLDETSVAESFGDIYQPLREVLPMAPAASASDCLGVQVMGDALNILFVSSNAAQIRWGPLGLLAASRFPIFRVLCAASTPTDDLAGLFLLPLQLSNRDEAWAEEVAKRASPMLGRGRPGAQAAAWAAWFVLGLMGVRSGAQSALAQAQLLLMKMPLSELLPSSLFCVLHALKLWRLRKPGLPRALPPPLPPWMLLTDQVLYVTAAWGSAARSISRWLLRAREIGLDALVYCLDDVALRACQKAGGECIRRPQASDNRGPRLGYGADKYELLLAVVSGGRTAVWADIDSHFLVDPSEAVAQVIEVGVTRDSRAACIHGGLIVLRPNGAPQIEELVRWLHHFPFGSDHNGFNALVRGADQAPGLLARFKQPTLLDPELFTGADGVVVAEPAWLYLWTPGSEDGLGEFFEEAAMAGGLPELSRALVRERPRDLADGFVFQVALKAPVMVRVPGVGLRSLSGDRGDIEALWSLEATEEASWQRRVRVLAGAAYETGSRFGVQPDKAKATTMFTRAAALGDRQAAERLGHLSPSRRILGLL